MRINVKLTAIALTGAIALFAAPSPTYATDNNQTKKTETKEIVVTIAEGDTLSSIADANKTTYVRIFNANENLSSPDAINAGDKVRIPKDDEQLPDRFGQYQASVASSPAVVASTASTYTTRGYTSAPVNANSYYVGNGMWCTDYVHSRRPDVPVYGNAGYGWVSAAQRDGKATGTTPQAGAVAVTNGHVAYVNSVNADGSYNVSEMGWNYRAGNYNERTVQPGAFGAFIY
jgi:surface antigen